MGYLWKNKSIRTRLHQVTLLTILVFVIIASYFYFAAQRTWTNADQIFKYRLEQTIQNSHYRRDFGSLFSRLDILRQSFLGDSRGWNSDGLAIQKDLNALQSNLKDWQLKELLAELGQQLDRYLKRGTWINTLLSDRTNQDKDLEDLTLILQELITERIMAAALVEDTVSHYNQLIDLPFQRS